MNQQFSFQMIGENEKSLCVFWDEPVWSNEGCHVIYYNGTQTVCSCNHLSTFAILMASVELKVCIQTHMTLKISSAVGWCWGGRQGSSKRRWKNINRVTALYLPLFFLFFFIFLNSRIMLYNAMLVSAVHQHEYVHQHKYIYMCVCV